MENEPTTRATWQPTVAVLLLALLVGVAAYHTITSQPSSPRYEYKIESIPDASFKASMDAAGFEGWEAISARRASDGASSPTFSYEVIFKRAVSARPQSPLIPLKTP